MSQGPKHVKGHSMFGKQREFRFRQNVVCMEEVIFRKFKSHVMTDCILVKSFVLLKTVEKHWRFVNCEIIGSSICFKKLIANSGRIFQSGGTHGLEHSWEIFCGLLKDSIGSEDGKEGLKSTKVKSMIGRK